MEKITIVHYSLALMGLIIYILFELIKAQKKYNESFRVISWFQTHYLSVIASALVTIALMISANELISLEIIPEKMQLLMKIFSIFIGYSNTSLLKKVFQIYSPKRK